MGTMIYTNVFFIACYVIPSGFEPEAYCLEGSCSIQLSYGTDLFDDFHEIACKGRHFFGNSQIFEENSYLRRRYNF